VGREVESSLEPHVEKNPALSAEKIQRQLERILDSPEFHATARQREFLRFVVTESLRGRSEEIKGYTIATEVFGRKDFDQATDPIVSIQANLLRRALERYYLIAGKEDPIRIDIPKGTYVPLFHEQRAVDPDEIPFDGKRADLQIVDSWPSVAVLPLVNLTGDPEKDYLGMGLATELAIEIARFQEITVSLHEQDAKESSVPGSVIRFAVGGSIRKDKTGIKMTVHLTDNSTGRQIWGDTYRCDFEASQMTAFEEEVARIIAANVAGERGIIARTLSVESNRKKPLELKTYEAILRYYQYDWTLDPDTFLGAFQALEHAARIEPECGHVWSMLARLYGNGYSLEIPGFETALEKALGYAEKGVSMMPSNQRAILILAFVRMFAGELPAARVDIRKALALGPNSLFMLDGVGYLMTLLGEWEKGPALIRKVIKLNPFYNTVVHYALWEDCLRNEDYEGAYGETMSLRRPSVFWYPMVKAATLGLLGRHKEGKQFAEHLLKLKPNFQARGRLLIGHYIKFEDIVQRVIEGLRKVGLNIT
jgi:adenylate cyclase